MDRLTSALLWTAAAIAILFLAFFILMNDEGSATEVALLEGTSVSTPLEWTP